MVCAIDREHLLLLALVSHDAGWISFYPSVGLPAMLLALGFQFWIMLSHCKSRDFALLNEVAIFCWIIGSEIWTISEYLWDNGIPAGFLDNFEVFQTFEDKWYPIAMSVAVTLMIGTCVALAATHVLRRCCARRIAAACQGRATLESQCQAEGAQGEICQCFPLRVYENLFLLPWIWSDTTWALCNMLDTFNIDYPGQLICFSAVTGMISISIQADLVRRHVRARHDSDAAICLAELFWVFGNVLWMMEDCYWQGDCWQAHYGALALFVISLGLTSFIVLISRWPSASTRIRDQCPMLSARLLPTETESVSALEASPRRLSPDNVAMLESAFNGTLPSPLLSCEALNVTIVPDRIGDEKKPRARHRRSHRTPKFMRDVVVLARRLPDCDIVKVAADLAVRALGDPDKPIVILNVGQVGRRLEEWRSRLPRVFPRYAVRHHADKKVLQLLREGHCSFECATTNEVEQMLAHGVPSQELFFSQPCGTRSHLGFIRDKGVQLMPFDNAVELRKVAVEHPGARLLLQISGEDLESSPARRQPRNMLARFGAVRSDWEPLLDLAVELRLQVVGISLAAGQSCQEASHFEKVLLDSHHAFKLGAERGFDMSLLDLGDNLFADLGSKTCVCTTFVDKALQLDKHLASIFPAEAFPRLKISAEVGNFLSHDAIALLTKVVAKTLDEPQHDQLTSPDGKDSPPRRIQYALNDNLGVPYFRPRVLDGNSDVTPEVLGDDADQPRQCCMISSGVSSSVIAEVTIPEVEQDEWLLWRRAGNHLLVPGTKRQTSSNLSNGRAGEQTRSAQVCVWYYAEEEVQFS